MPLGLKFNNKKCYEIVLSVGIYIFELPFQKVLVEENFFRGTDYDFKVKTSHEGLDQSRLRPKLS
jgi:hypothetical protein